MPRPRASVSVDLDKEPPVAPILERRTVHRFLALLRPEAKRLAWGLVFLALSSTLPLVFPQTVRRTIDEALQRSDMHLVDRMGALALAILLVQAAATAARYYLFTFLGERLVRALRAQLFQALLRQEIGFFDSSMTGDLMSRLNADSTVLQNALSVNISMMLRSAVMAGGGFALLFYTSTKLTLALLAAIPPAAFFGARFGGKVRGLSRRSQEALGAANAVADETLTNVRTVRSFAAEPAEGARFERALDVALAASRQRVATIARFMGAMSLWGLAAITGVLWYGARLVIAGELSVGTLSAYILYTLTVATSVATLSSLWTDFMSAIGASSRIFQILDREPALPLDVGLELPATQGTIALRATSFSYPGRPDAAVLHAVDLAIAPGEVVALVGASGSGKSTIAALVQRFYDPTTGSVCLDGHDLRELSGSWLRRQIGTVSQEPVLMSTSIRDNIGYGRPDAPLEAIEAAARSAHAEEFIKRFAAGYDTLVGERGVQLSGGQRQRVAIARAMLKDPRILILDEATSALDAESEALVQEALQRLMVGRSVLIIAHRLSTVRHADRVVVMDHGRIVQQGRHEDLLRDASGPYFQLVSKQMSG